MRGFAHQAAATRVVFGEGDLDRVPAEVEALDLRRVLVLAGASAKAHADLLVTGLGPRAAGRFDRVAPHVPEPLVDDAVAAAGLHRADGLVSIGGGSATGLAKAVAVALDLPIVAVPTTYAGSEATETYGITGARKRTATDPRARVRTVVYDPRLTASLPPGTAAASGFNALAHAVAALAGPGHEPVAELFAAEAVRIIARALPAAIGEPGAAARGDLLWAAWLAGTGLSLTGAGLHHRLCHVLGGRYRLVHAEAHAVLLPYTVARDPALSSGGVEQVAAALGAVDAATGLRALAASVGLPDSLAAIGMPEDGIADAAAESATVLGGDPDWFRALLLDTYHGRSSS